MEKDTQEEYCESHEHNDLEGFNIVELDAFGNVLDPVKKKKKDENYDCGSEPDASEIPSDEQIAILEQAKPSKLKKGDRLALEIFDGLIIIKNGDKKVGNLKKAFCEQLLSNRKGQHAEVFYHCDNPAPMVKLVFYAKAKKGTVKIKEPPK